MKDPFDDPKLKAYLRHAKEEMFPKMQGSALSLIINGEADPKLCLELGAAILFDKPIVVVVPDGKPVSANLKRVAAHILHLDMNDPSSSERLQRTISEVIENDRRAKGSA